MKSLIEDLHKNNSKVNLEKIHNDVVNNNKLYNSFVTICDDYKLNDKNNILNNICYAMKDNISTKGILTTASSNTLKDYIPPYNATVYQKLLNSGAIMVGKTSMDEFGMGGKGITAHTGIVKNPFDTTRSPGGSSAGSAVAVASNLVPFAIGSDTGDSVRKPAAYCGIVGYKPTYGMISRYGLLPFASSLDHIGVLTKYVKDAAIVVDEIKGRDIHDMTSIDSSSINLVKNLDMMKGKKTKLFYIKEIVDPSISDDKEYQEMLKSFNKSIECAKNLGMEVYEESISKDLLSLLSVSYTCISASEATSNMSNLTGIIFGPRGEGNDVNEMMIDYRTKGFSPLIKRRFVIGSYVLQKENQEKYLNNAKRIRAKIVGILRELFKKYDALILPASKGISPKITEVSDSFTNSVFDIIENHMVMGNFGGMPSITIPSDYIDNMPIGINLTSDIYQDEKLLSIAGLLEDEIKFDEKRDKNGI